MVSNRRRNRRTIGKLIASTDTRLNAVTRRPAPRAIGKRTVTNDTIARGAVDTPQLAAPVTGKIDDAAAAAATAQSTADGKNKVYRQTSEPTGGTYVSGDVWFDTDDNNKIYRYDSTIAPPASKWVAVQLGGNALANINANAITAGTIDASVITVSNINAGNITTGAINASGVELGNDVGPGTGHNGLSLSDSDFNNIFLRRESDNVTFFRVNSGGTNSMTFDSSSGTLNITGTVTASSGTIGGFTLSDSSLAASNSSVETQMFTNGGGPYGDSNLKTTYKGGIWTKLTTTNEWSAQAYDGFYSITPISGTDKIAYFRRNAATVTNGSQRLWLDASNNCIRYTTDGSSGFPGIITSEYCRLSFDTNGVVSTSNDFGVGTTSNQATSNTVSASGTWLASDGLVTMTRGTQILILNGTQATASTAQAMIRFRRLGGDIPNSNLNSGTITASSAGVTYNTSSDYRLKENVKNLETGLQTVSKLRPVEYTWKSAPEIGVTQGFIAHELQEFVPYAVTGEKDAVDEEGRIDPQQVDYSRLTPILTAAIKELSAKVSQLEAEIESLKNAQ